MIRKGIPFLINLTAFLLATSVAGGCGLINENLQPCPPPRTLRVPVTYTMNMAFADALPRQVESLTLYISDTDGHIISTITRDIDQLAADGYAFTPELEPGTYNLLIWGVGRSPADDPVNFNIADGDDISQISATLPLQNLSGRAYSDRDITPLFHAFAENVAVGDDTGEIILPTLDLVKDTNVIQVAIQSADRSAINPDDFAISIEANNSQLSYLNDIMASPIFSYHPWAITPLSASYDNAVTTQNRDNEATIVINGLLAELSTGRLTIGHEPTLIVTRLTDGKQIIRINLIEYFLLVKGQYNRQMTDQEYLDRTDSYSLLLFLDSAGEWYSRMGVFINGWRIVPPQTGAAG